MPLYKLHLCQPFLNEDDDAYDDDDVNKLQDITRQQILWQA